MKQQDPKFEVVPLSEVPREDSPAQDKDKPYATDVAAAGRKHAAGLFCFCRNCELRFPLKQSPRPAQDYAGEIWLRCPYCGHLDQYTLADLLRASEQGIGKTGKLVQ